MSKPVIKIENLSKLYRIGEIGTGTISHDLNRWWTTKIRRKEDPFAKVGQVNDRTSKAEKGEHVWALKDINLEVNQGDILGIIGKNGAGKSTLLKLLSRVTSPTTGSIKVKGRMASLLEVGTGFHPEMTGRENIYMNGTIMGMRRWEIDRKLDEIVDFAGIEKYLDTPTKRYSSGMTVRLGFAIAAFLEPEILVVDEVLAVGDAEFQKKAIGKMQDVSKGEGRTVLFVSHNMGSLRSLCHRGIWIKNGMLKYQNEINEVVDSYLFDSSYISDLSLRDRQDRRGSKRLYANDILLLNADTKKQVKEIVPGINVKIRIHYSLNDEAIHGNTIRVGISITDRNHSFITVLHNKMSGFILSIDKTKKYFECEVPQFPLTVGEFYFRLIIEDEVTSEIYDWIDDAKKIVVIENDFYKSGYLSLGDRQGVYLNQKWS